MPRRGSVAMIMCQSQSQSRSRSFAAVRLIPALVASAWSSPRRVPVNCRHQTWKACWVHALGGSNPPSSAGEAGCLAGRGTRLRRSVPCAAPDRPPATGRSRRRWPRGHRRLPGGRPRPLPSGSPTTARTRPRSARSRILRAVSPRPARRAPPLRRCRRHSATQPPQCFGHGTSVDDPWWRGSPLSRSCRDQRSRIRATCGSWSLTWSANSELIRTTS